MHDGHGAVGHGVELVEAAGLEAAGHEQQVGAGGDAVRQAHIEADPAAALLVPPGLHLPAGIRARMPQCFRAGLFATHAPGCRSEALIQIGHHRRLSEDL